MSTATDLMKYIRGETNASAYYRALAEKAPDATDMKLLLEFAADEKGHANSFKSQYYRLTGKTYDPTPETPKLLDNWADNLRERVLDESGDYRTYRDAYLENRDPGLRRAFFEAATDENVHALRLLYMLSKK